MAEEEDRHLCLVCGSVAEYLTKDEHKAPFCTKEHHQQWKDVGALDFRNILFPSRKDRKRRALVDDGSLSLLLSDSVHYTHNVIVGYLMSNSAKQVDYLGVMKTRLLTNQNKIGDAVDTLFSSIGMGYGPPESLKRALRDHVVETFDLLNAVRSGDRENIQRTKSSWYNQGKYRVAKAISMLVPNSKTLTEAAAVEAVTVYLDYTLAEVEALFSGNSTLGAEKLDAAKNHMVAVGRLIMKEIAK